MIKTWQTEPLINLPERDICSHANERQNHSSRNLNSNCKPLRPLWWSVQLQLLHLRRNHHRRNNYRPCRSFCAVAKKTRGSGNRPTKHRRGYIIDRKTFSSARDDVGHESKRQPECPRYMRMLSPSDAHSLFSPSASSLTFLLAIFISSRRDSASCISSSAAPALPRSLLLSCLSNNNQATTPRSRSACNLITVVHECSRLGIGAFTFFMKEVQV